MVVIRESRADFFKRSSREEKQRKAKRISSSRATSVTRRTNKGTVTVTKAGLVTERDFKGNLISRYSTQPSKAKEFVALESFKISRNVEIKRQIASRQKILSKAGNIRARTLPREGGGTVTVTKAGQVTERNSRGQVVKRFRTSPSQAVNFLNIKTPKRLPIILPGFKPTLPSGGTRLPTQQQMNLFRKKEVILAKGGFKKSSGVIDVPKKEKGIKELQRLAAAEKRKQLGKIDDPKTGAAERQLRTIAVLGFLGVIRGGLGVLQTIKRPDKAALNIISAALRPVQTIKTAFNEFKIDPVGVVIEYYTYSKALNLAGKAAKSSKVGRFVKEELFIRGQPKKLQPVVRKILKASKVQEKINPTRIKSLKNVNFFEIKSLTRTEAIALKKTLQNTDSVIFGSVSARTISRGKTPIPKDVDIATRSITKFNNIFIKNMPKRLRTNYILKGEKLIRRSSNSALFDIKPINRLIPSRSLLSRRGRIPVVGYVKKLVKKKGSLLPKIVRKKVTGKLTIPTQKLVKVQGIKLTGFGEQTTRKGLGTLQVLIEKNVRRAKDPQSFLISLEIQLKFLKKTKPKTIVGRRILKGKVNKLDSAIKLLKSRQFSRLLEKKVPGITKNYPLVNKINVKLLKKITPTKTKKGVRLALRKNKIPFAKTSKLSKSRLPKSRLPKSRLPSKIPKSSLLLKPTIPKLSRIPKIKASSIPKSQIPKSSFLNSVFNKPSKISRLTISIIPISRIPTSKIPRSKVPGSRIPPSKIPPSKIPTSRIPPTRLRVRKVTPIKDKPKIFDDDDKKKKQLTKLTKSKIKNQKFIYIPDLYSVIYGIKASTKQRANLLRKGRVFSGISIRKLV